MPPTDEFNEKSTVIKIVVDFLFVKKYCYNKKGERQNDTGRIKKTVQGKTYKRKTMLHCKRNKN